MSEGPGLRAKHPAAGNGRTVLVVDDDPALLRSTHRILEMHGYRVLTAANAVEARQRIGEAEGGPDLVLMDLVLPGLEGREAANLLLARDPGVRILFMSGYTSLESMRLGAFDENQAFLRKPFEVPDLLSAVESALA